MFETLGVLLIVVGAGGLALLGLYALVPGLIPTRSWGRPSRIRIEEKRLLSVADVTPHAMAKTLGRPQAGHLNPRLADEIFAELFALRTDIAGITLELRVIREQLESTAATDMAAEADLAAALNAA